MPSVADWDDDALGDGALGDRDRDPADGRSASSPKVPASRASARLGWVRETVAGALGGLPPLRIEGERVHLRPPRGRDWRAWCALRAGSRSFLEPWEPRWPDDALSRAAFARRYKRQVKEWKDDEAYALFVCERATDRLIGGLNVSHVRRGVAQTATLGYWIGADHARQGYMTEAVVCALQFCFHHLGLHRVEAACLPRNEASNALLARVGFTREGKARDYLRINGRWEDHYLYAMIRRDYEAMGRE